MCLEERIKMLKEELDRQSINYTPKQKEEIENIKKTVTVVKPGKQMVSIEIQANEQDIRDAYKGNITIIPLADGNDITDNLSEDNLMLESEEEEDDDEDVSPLHDTETSSNDVLSVLKSTLLKRKHSRELLNCDEDDESESDSDLKICEEICA